MLSLRKTTREIRVGDVSMGNGSPISVQSMTNTDTHDQKATLHQIEALQEAGCDIIRLAVPDLEAAETFRFLKAKKVKVPLVADVHFDHRIALACVAAGADKIRINPGNIGSDERVRMVADACRARRIPIRIGVNSGSLEKEILAKHGSPTPQALAESAMYHIGLLEKLGFYDIAVSVKASNVPDMIEANRILSAQTDHPLHLGVTEAGSAQTGQIKSAIGIGALLAEGIGDTIRVSLTADPVAEVAAGHAILNALSLRKETGMDIIACPTCGRTRIDLIPLLAEFEEKIDRLGLRRKSIKVAFMGCVVNGPGEAREADIGVAGGIGEGIFFRRGQITHRVPENEIVDTLIREIQSL